MARISTLAFIIASAGLTACAQTGETQASAAQEAQATSTGDVMLSGVSDPTVSTQKSQEDIHKSQEDMKSHDMEQKTDVTSSEKANVWLKYGLASLYNKDGTWLHALQNSEPLKIYETKDDMARISDSQDHWVRRIDLSAQPPKIRPVLRTGPPDRPVTKFPNILEEEIKRRGIEVKKHTP